MYIGTYMRSRHRRHVNWLRCVVSRYTRVSQCARTRQIPHITGHERVWIIIGYKIDTPSLFARLLGPINREDFNSKDKLCNSTNDRWFTVHLRTVPSYFRNSMVLRLEQNNSLLYRSPCDNKKIKFVAGVKHITYIYIYIYMQVYKWVINIFLIIN